ncbi:G patch domain-containing protein 11 [Forsythia ovata]|uniref:G patch domain-containing protein 11 n=1 Tax=Forsythia ovata TaxID=205694 RepID=A0ABD1W7S7_9LAMI
MELASGFDDASSSGLGMDRVSNMGSSTSTPINSSNIGFQGRLEPVHAYVNNNKRGLGSYKPKKAKEQLGNLENPDGKCETDLEEVENNFAPPKNIPNQLRSPTNGLELIQVLDKRVVGVPLLPKKKAKGISKKLKKMQEFEERLQEKEFDRTFFREFWPDNV